MFRLLTLGIAVLVLLATPSLGSSAPLNPPPTPLAPPKASPPSASIPAPEVAKQADAVAKQLREFDALLGPGTTVETIEKRLPELAARVAAQADVTARQLDAEAVGSVLDDLTLQWQATRVELAGYVNILAERATALEKAQERLSVLRETWTRGRADAQASRAPAQVTERIDSVLASIAAARARLQPQRSAILVLQDRVAQEVARCEGALERIAAARQAAARGLGDRDSPSLWQAGQLALAARELPEQIRRATSADLAQLREFARGQRWKVHLHVALFFGLIVLIQAARRKTPAWISSGERPVSGPLVLERPISAALVLTLVASVLIYSPPIPRSAGALAQVVALVPAVRIMRLLVEPRLVTGLYVLSAFFLVDLVRHLVSVVPVLEQQVFVFEALAAVIVLAGWALRTARRRVAPTAGEEAARGLPLVAGGALLVLFAGALIAGVAGYMQLALLLGASILGNGYIAMVIYAAVRVGDGLVAFLLRVRPLRYLKMVQHHRPFLERRSHGVLRALGIGGWAYLALRYFGLWNAAVTLTESALAAELHRGAFAISLGDVLAFVLTIGAVFVLSGAIRFVLEEDVYPHLSFGGGLMQSLSSLLHYVLLLVGFLLALAMLGVDFTKITILVGAFGVGIGFGLQGIVNNFVSGLIVLFERKIDVGDAVQIGEVSGRLQQLGVRACTVHTWEGAEVIVPNASLVSEKVTNWTLSNRSRRIDLPIGVAYGTSPDKVIEVMLGVARAHPNVLSTPPPVALFLGFGESALQFELRCWGQFDLWVQVRSELAVALYAALGEAGIEIPFPQREVRLRQ